MRERCLKDINYAVVKGDGDFQKKDGTKGASAAEIAARRDKRARAIETKLQVLDN